MNELSYIERPYVDLTSKDAIGNTRQYRIYNTLDYAIRIGYVLDGTDTPELLVPIQWFDEKRSVKVRENELSQESYEKRMYFQDVVHIANRLRSLHLSKCLVHEMQVDSGIGNSKYWQLRNAWNEVILTKDKLVEPYETYSARDRFLVPMETFLLYGMICEQSHRIYESLLCTHTRIPSYDNLPNVSPVTDKTEGFKGILSLDWKEYSEDGAFIFGQHEN